MMRMTKSCMSSDTCACLLASWLYVTWEGGLCDQFALFVCVSLCLLSVCVHVFEGCSFERGGGCLHCGLGQIIVFGQTALFAQQGAKPK